MTESIIELCRASLQARDLYNATVRLNDEHPGLDRLGDEETAKAEAAAALRATTLAEFQAKARLLKAWLPTDRTGEALWEGGDVVDRIAWSLIHDLLALQHPPS